MRHLLTILWSLRCLTFNFAASGLRIQVKLHLYGYVKISKVLGKNMNEKYMIVKVQCDREQSSFKHRTLVNCREPENDASKS